MHILTSCGQQFAGNVLSMIWERFSLYHGPSSAVGIGMVQQLKVHRGAVVARDPFPCMLWIVRVAIISPATVNCIAQARGGKRTHVASMDEHRQCRCHLPNVYGGARFAILAC